MPFTLASFNVKDLFDPTDAAGRAHLDAKLANLAAVLEGAAADVVVLQEVGSAAVVRALTARLPGLAYAEPIVGTADARGIRNALVARVPVIESTVHVADHLPFPTFVEGDPPPFGARIPLRRGVVHARVEAPGIGPVDVIGAHFKSNLPLARRNAAGELVPPATERERSEGHLRSLVWRSAEALFVRGVVDELLREDPARHVVVAGDLNDRPGSPVVRSIAGGGPGALWPCAEVVPAARRFSIYLRGEPLQIDHVLATRALRDRVQSARFCNEELRDHGGLKPFDPLGPPAPPTVDSDHAALVVSFA